ncbi:MAG TPA: PTS sucrose transporter subunit IIBC [Ktedonobacter sp.]|nr:PTS sucrose transporter subunit IIBC [Ktedonobacter sp.]
MSFGAFITNGFFIADFWGALIALPLALGVIYWVSNVRNKAAVVGGAFIGVLVGFIGILLWLGPVFHANPLPNTDPVAVFFGTLFACAILGLIFGLSTDLIIARRNERDYRRQLMHE